jgi:hypothetical protein
MQLAHRIFKGLVTMAVLGIALIATLLTALWLEHRTEVTLPTLDRSIRGGPDGLRLG